MSTRLYPILALWPLLAILCGLASCTKEIDIRPRAEVQVVASCVLANTDLQRLKLTYSKEMGQGHYFDEVEQATATLYEEGTAGAPLPPYAWASLSARGGGARASYPPCDHYDALASGCAAQGGAA